MSHMVARSNANGPSAGQNGDSSGARHGLISEWYSAVEKTVCLSFDGVSTRILPSASCHTWAVAARLVAKLDGPGPHSRSRFSRAWSTPRSENPNRSSTTCPGSDGPAHMSPNGRSVVGRIRSKSSRVPPGMSRRSYQSICRQRGSSHSTWMASGAPSTTISPCAMPGLSECRCARSGTVRPCGMVRPPSEKSMTSRASRCAGNVYRCTADLGPTVISARIPLSSVAA